MSLAKADSRALKQARDMLYKYGGSGVWSDFNDDAVKDDFGNIITPATTTDYDISILPIEVEQGWINSGIATANNKVFLISAKELSDYEVVFNENENITYNGDTLKIERDEPYMGGQGVMLHRFICSVT
jgi:hypothetical protein